MRFSGLTTLSSSSTVESLRPSNSSHEENTKATSPDESFHSVESTLNSVSPDSKLIEIEQQLKEWEEEEEDKTTDNEISDITKEAELKLSGTPKRRRSLHSTLFVFW